jgi:hypothetical protein
MDGKRTNFRVCSHIWDGEDGFINGVERYLIELITVFSGVVGDENDSGEEDSLIRVMILGTSTIDRLFPPCNLSAGHLIFPQHLLNFGEKASRAKRFLDKTR